LFRSAEVGLTHLCPRAPRAIFRSRDTRSSSKKRVARAVTARGARRNERTGAGVVRRLFDGVATQLAIVRASLIGIASGGVRASETREVSGPRAHDDQTRWKGAWVCGYASLNRRRDRGPGFGGSVARVPNGTWETAGDADGPRAGAFRSDSGTQRSERFGSGSSNRVPVGGTARGVGIHGAKLQIAGRASSTDGAARLHRPRWSRAGRRATRGMRRNIVATEVGDGLTAMPLVFPAGRANGRRRT